MGEREQEQQPTTSDGEDRRDGEGGSPDKGDAAAHGYAAWVRHSDEDDPPAQDNDDPQ